ncbi:MAG: hypothetical protein ACRD2T_16485 [Thermoanaerobaculia bacterium]
MSSQPPSFEPPVAPPPPAPAPPKRGWLKWVGLGCGCLVLAVVGFFLLTYFGVRAATAGPEQIVHRFLEAAEEGDYEEAHGYFAAPLKQAQPLDRFSAEAQANSSFFQITDTTFNQRSIDTAGAKFSGTVTLESGTEMPASFELVRENDEWKLISYHIGAQ